MKTDRLIALLADDAAPIEPRRVAARFAVTLGGAGFLVLMLSLSLLGMRPDIAVAAQRSMFWWKLLFPGSIGVFAWIALRRLGHPGARLGWMPWLIAAMFLLAWGAGSAQLLAAAPVDRALLLLGHSAGICPELIVALSVPAAAAAFWAERHLAPTQPVVTGAVAGLFAGASAACAYALHCTEMELPFVATWYSLGMLIPAAVGALAGKKFLHW